jgi:hypothetical protein
LNSDPLSALKNVPTVTPYLIDRQLVFGLQVGQAIMQITAEKRSIFDAIQQP